MAKLKYEFLAHYHERHGVPLRARLFGDIATLSQLGCRTAPLSNWTLRSRPFRWALDRFVRIDARRPLPPFARRTFAQWFRTRSPASSHRSGRPVALFNDTFMNFNYPEIGRAAVRVLEALGYEVILAEKKCCGRPMISKGLIEPARQHARWNVAALAPYAEKGIPVVGLEPSCLLTLRDEYPDLVDDPRAGAVAKNAVLIEELLQKHLEEGHLPAAHGPLPAKVLFHGHCHQKALVGSAASLSVLRTLPGVQVIEVDSGCCGMAGSFGFEKEHYDLSLAIGGRRLFPAIDGAPGAAVVASGVSCRQQIAHATGRRARHLVEVLAAAWDEPGG
jgi:Fe-S oxidoreductase